MYKIGIFGHAPEEINEDTAKKSIRQCLDALANQYGKDLIFNIAILVSMSGGIMSTTNPPLNLDFNLSSMSGIIMGGLSEEKTICLPSS